MTVPSNVFPSSAVKVPQHWSAITDRGFTIPFYPNACTKTPRY